jgi:hypothetical protein
MLLKPVVPLGPLIVKIITVVVLRRFEVISALDICELEMLPLIIRVTISPLFVADITALAE